MDNLLENFGHFIIAYPTWRFLILAGAAVIQGEFAVLLSLYLIQDGSLSWPVFITAVLSGLFVVESLLYFFGKTMRQTRLGWRWYYKIKGNRRLQIYTYFLKTNMVKIFVIAKFIPATNFIIIFLTGWSKTKVGLFFKVYFLSLLTWFVGITAIAYPFASGLYYLRATKVFRQAEIGLVIVFLLIFAGEYVLRKILRRASIIAEKSAVIGKVVEEELGKKETK